MALHDVTAAFLRRFRNPVGPLYQASKLQCRQYATTQASQETPELEESSFVGGGQPSEAVAKFDPAATARKRNRRLPPSRYQFRSPLYYRGPLHPHQPPKPSDPASREHEAGPFSLPRLEQTYHDTFASDFMTMTYTHFPPGTEPHKKGDRLRSWVGNSPYYKNRPLRGPRGGDVLKLLRKPITFRNVPRLERVTIHTMVKEAINDSAPLHVAGMVLQAISSVRAEAHKTKKNVAGFGIRVGQYLSLTCELEGENMYHFLSKCVDMVMPRIKDFKGVKGSSGDSSGHLHFGLTAEDVALFPEVEVNYDMYPPKMIPGCHVTIHTSAKDDRDARLLLTQIGVPFYGKQIN
ncbi:hypothetical protein LTR08_002808 [Meristemomyces frigidus]|nr:hypothetical protein LTR08_002808 [Meristemomyces frigidus]